MTTTPHGQVPEALRLADELEDSLASHDGSSLTARYQGIADDAAAELRRQHARIADLAAQLEAIGAGGVTGPLIGQPQAMPDLSALTERGSVAWAGVDAQGLREGATDMSKERDAFERALTELAARYDEAIQPSEFSRDDTGAYHNALTEISWMLWQAHTSLSANAGFTAADMATAEARGFRDGAASLAASAGEVVPLDVALHAVEYLGMHNSASRETEMVQMLRKAAQLSPTAQAADSVPAPHSEPWYGHQFKEVRRGYWQCSCGKAIAEAVPSASKDSYPPLPNRYAYDDDGGEMFTADHMRAYADETYALRARQPAPATQQAREVSDAMVLAALQVQYPATYGQHLRHPADGPKTSIRTEAEIDTARRMVVAALAAAPQPSPTAQAAESVTAAATESYVQPVPDKCDRIVWRGHYYHLPPAQAAESVLEDAARLDFLIEQRAYVVSDPDACAGHWLHWAEPDGSTLVQGDEHPTPRAAIDAARKQGGAT